MRNLINNSKKIIMAMSLVSILGVNAANAMDVNKSFEMNIYNEKGSVLQLTGNAQDGNSKFNNAIWIKSTDPKQDKQVYVNNVSYGVANNLNEFKKIVQSAPNLSKINFNQIEEINPDTQLLSNTIQGMLGDNPSWGISTTTYNNDGSTIYSLATSKTIDKAPLGEVITKEGKVTNIIINGKEVGTNINSEDLTKILKTNFPNAGIKDKLNEVKHGSVEVEIMRN